MKGLDTVKSFSIKTENLFLVYNTFLLDLLLIVHVNLKYKEKVI